MSRFDPSLTAGIFNLSDVIHFQLGFAVRSQGLTDFKIDFLIFTSRSSPAIQTELRVEKHI